METIGEIDVIAPNFKRRYSGVTSTVIQLVPLQRRLGLSIAAMGPGLPDRIPRLPLRSLLNLWGKPASGRPFRIWHARRNVEMVAGILLKHVLRAPLRLIFTSAAQRDHRAFTKWLIRHMDAVITTSERSGSYLKVPHAVIMHGVDTERFCPPRDKKAAKAAVGLDPAKHYIGCFGRIRPSKGTDLFVGAMIKLLHGHPGWAAVITGRTTAEHVAFARDLQRRIDEAGLADRIRILGEVPDVIAYYQAIDLYVAPSRREGFGLTPLEAMACGVPAVTSDAGAYAEMILPGGTGAVAPAGDGNALTAEIATYLQNPALAGKHGKAGLAHVRASFVLEGEARALAGIYESLWEEAG